MLKLTSQNKTKVGLKVSRVDREVMIYVCQNKTKVGLKALLVLKLPPSPTRQNKTKVGLKAPISGYFVATS